MIMGDNYGAMTLAKNPVDHQRTKHIDIRYHFIREKVSEKIVTIHHVPSKEQTVDIFTKLLDHTLFKYHRKKLCILPT